MKKVFVDITKKEPRKTVNNTRSNDMENVMFERLKPHIGHRIVCVYYGDKEDPCDVCIECEDCNEIIISAEEEDS
jgi:hypothetical protein